MRDNNSTRQQPFLFKVEMLACFAVTLIAVWLHWRFLNCAGALWRDEAGSVGMATVKNLRELWAMLTYDSFPLFLPVSLRVWSAVCPIAGDFGLRLYGLLVGLGLLGAIWFNGWVIGRKPPVIALALLAFNPVFIRWGDSLRAYGAGCVFILLTLGLVWRLVSKPTWGRFALASLAAVLSVQTLYQNAFLVLAICGVGASLCAGRKQWRHAAQVLAAGAVAAVSLGAYVPASIRSQAWWEVQKSGFNAAWIRQNIVGVISTPNAWQQYLWLGLVIISAVVGVRGLLRKKELDRERVLFSVGVMVSSIPLFLLFVWLSGMATQVWYFLPLLALVALCADIALTNWLPQFAEWRLTMLLILVVTSFGEASASMKIRMTNLDVVAQRLAAEAQKDDLIVVYPWHCGLSFNRYYHGAARWTSVPPMTDYRFHRYDQFREKMQIENPVASLIEDCRRTLVAGHRVWLVGAYSFPEAAPENLALPPNAPWGWFEIPYELNYMERVGYFLSKNAQEIVSVATTSPGMISEYEDLPLLQARGWRGDEPPPNPAATKTPEK